MKFGREQQQRFAAMRDRVQAGRRRARIRALRRIIAACEQELDEIAESGTLSPKQNPITREQMLAVLRSTGWARRLMVLRLAELHGHEAPWVYGWLGRYPKWAQRDRENAALLQKAS